MSSSSISKSSEHPSSKFNTVERDSLNCMIFQDHDHINNRRVINKTFGVKESWHNFRDNKVFRNCYAMTLVWSCLSKMNCLRLAMPIYPSLIPQIILCQHLWWNYYSYQCVEHLHYLFITITLNIIRPTGSSIKILRIFQSNIQYLDIVKSTQ